MIIERGLLASARQFLVEVTVVCDILWPFSAPLSWVGSQTARIKLIAVQ